MSECTDCGNEKVSYCANCNPQPLNPAALVRSRGEAIKILARLYAAVDQYNSDNSAEKNLQDVGFQLIRESGNIRTAIAHAKEVGKS